MCGCIGFEKKMIVCGLDCVCTCFIHYVSCNMCIIHMYHSYICGVLGVCIVISSCSCEYCRSWNVLFILMCILLIGDAVVKNVGVGC